MSPKSKHFRYFLDLSLSDPSLKSTRDHFHQSFPSVWILYNSLLNSLIGISSPSNLPSPTLVPCVIGTASQLTAQLEVTTYRRREPSSAMLNWPTCPLSLLSLSESGLTFYSFEFWPLGILNWYSLISYLQNYIFYV